MNTHRRLVPAALAAAVVACTVAGCGSTTVGQSTTTAPSTTTTTTTTLPTAVGVTATTPVGALASLGPVERVPVVPLSAGVNALPNPPKTGESVQGTVKIAFRQFGNGPDLVLAMGEHGSMTWWDPQLLTDLAGKFRVTVFDYPNIGYSATSPGMPTIEGYGDALAGLIDSLGLKSPVVLGWGLGGEAALSFAEQHVGLYSGLVLVDTTAGGPTETLPTPAIARIFASPISTMIQLSKQMFPTSEATAAEDWLQRLSEVSPDDVIASAIVAQAKEQALFHSDPVVARSLGVITAPTLVVAGADDVVIPPANSTVVADGIRGAKLKILPDSGYGSMFEDEPEFVSTVDTFLQTTFATTTTTTATSTATTTKPAG